MAALGNGSPPSCRRRVTAKTTAHAMGVRPDLQGIWNTNTLLPLERPRQHGTRAMMTEEEHAKALAELQERNKRPGRDSRDVGGKAGTRHGEGRRARV